MVQITTERILIQSLLLLLFFSVMTILLQLQTVRTSCNQHLKACKTFIGFLAEKSHYLVNNRVTFFSGYTY